jgi:hypothetical protein
MADAALTRLGDALDVQASKESRVKARYFISLENGVTT